MSVATEDPMARWKPAPLLPRDEEREFSLHFVVAVLCFLACLAAVAAIGADRAASGWARDIRGEATVQVRPKLGETGSTAAARAAEALAGVKGVTEAAALEKEKAEALLKPWLGDAVLDDLPIPHLVTVRLDPKAPATAADLHRALSAAGIDGDVDDHARWLRDVERAAGLVRWIAFGVFVVVAAAAGAVVAFATRAGMAAQKDVVEVLHLSGARDEFIARVFQTRFGRLAFEAGAVGALAAIAVALILKLLGGQDGFTPALPLSWWDVTAVSPCPLIAATVAALAARLTTLRLLRGWE
ncbi:FtsX-like permease family protein [Caulobacter sp. 17J65-9]|uniref:cell division protein FtsX n=1 Tax=Caulobacter sp. 17J65-9 TaxID=2709382 RepID=UPI003204E7C1